MIAVTAVSVESAEALKALPAPAFPANPVWQGCASCHGAAGEGMEKTSGPRLAGQDSVYLRKQLEAFRSGTRPVPAGNANAQAMVAMAKALDAAGIDAALRAIAGFPVTEMPHRLLGDRQRGEDLYARGCAVCHGSRGEGMPGFHMARLNHQHSWYLAAQMLTYRQRRRGGEGSDPEAQTMAFYAGLLADERDVTDVIAFICRTKIFAEPEPAPSAGPLAKVEAMARTGSGEVAELQQYIADPGSGVPAEVALRAAMAIPTKPDPQPLLAGWRILPEPAQRAAAVLLAARASTALELLRACAEGLVPRHLLSAGLVRQLNAHQNPAIAARLALLAASGGDLPGPAADPAAEIARWRILVEVATLPGAMPPDSARGATVFRGRCAACHAGPGSDAVDRAGSAPAFASLEWADLPAVARRLLEPGATRAGRLVCVRAADGRVLVGERLPGPLSIATEAGVVPLPAVPETAVAVMDGSVMPAGLLTGLGGIDLAALSAFARGLPPRLDLTRGRALFSHHCGHCHAPDSRRIGPSLIEVRSLYPGDADGIAAWAAHPGRRRADYPIMPPMGLAVDDLRQIAAWILTPEPIALPKVGP
ncbi:hypothetical protein LBMAG53_07010 [Planctomycetota bacterium]|nr:hypothetical protein LBMAG53_07010 [Planctomycetota bacterium]